MIMRRIKSVIGIQADTKSNLKKLTLGVCIDISFYFIEKHIGSGQSFLTKENLKMHQNNVENGKKVRAKVLLWNAVSPN